MSVVQVPAGIQDFLGLQNEVIATTTNEEIVKIHSETKALFRQSVDEIKVIRRERLTMIGTSFAKDSTLTTIAALKAHIELMEEGVLNETSPFILCNVDTGVESALITLLAKYSEQQLKKFCTQHNINLVFKKLTPPVHQQWSSLFLSGLKLFSVSRLNNDCSVLLKVDQSARAYKELKEQYGQEIVTLLGTRVTDESIRRTQSVKKYGHDTLTASDLLTMNGSRQVLTPIVHFTTDHVWYYLNHCSINGQPVMKCFDGSHFFSFAENHRLLRLIYSEGSDGKTCPETDIQTKGEASPGGCGNTRYGCFTCLKMVKDKSSAGLNEELRHSLISGNAEKVRNWLMSIAQDINYRTYHSRAIDPLTNAIACVPNVLEGFAFEKAIRLMSQVTFDERMRAKKFSELVAQGREMEDIGYADIFNDPILDPEDKALMAELYKEFFVEPAIAPMSEEIAIYLSAIHARDGVKIAPYRAYALWHQVNAAEDLARDRSTNDTSKDFWQHLDDVKVEQLETGIRNEYPEVDLDNLKVDDIPDALMLMPWQSRDFVLGDHDTPMVEADAAVGCSTVRSYTTEKTKLGEIRNFLTDEEKINFQHDSDSKEVECHYVKRIELGKNFRKKRLTTKIRKAFSPRTIVKAKHSNEGIKILERGRTSINSPSFSERPVVPAMEASCTSSITLLVPSSNTLDSWIYTAEDSLDFSASYWVDSNALLQWQTMGGEAYALGQHNEYISSRSKSGKSIHRFNGTGPFYDLVRLGVIRMTERSHKNAQRITQRTEYFRSMGIFDLSIDELTERALSMPEYRSHKAKLLLTIRKQRNALRATLKREYATYWNNPTQGEIALADALTDAVTTIVYEAQFKAATSKLNLEYTTGFDTTDYRSELRMNTALLAQIKDQFSTPERFLKFSKSQAGSDILSNAMNKVALAKALETCTTRIILAQKSALKDVITFTSDPHSQFQDHPWKVMFSMFGFAMRNGKLSKNQVDEFVAGCHSEIKGLEKNQEIAQNNTRPILSLNDSPTLALLDMIA